MDTWFTRFLGNVRRRVANRTAESDLRDAAEAERAREAERQRQKKEHDDEQRRIWQAGNEQMYRQQNADPEHRALRYQQFSEALKHIYDTLGPDEANKWIKNNAEYREFQFHHMDEYGRVRNQGPPPRKMPEPEPEPGTPEYLDKVNNVRMPPEALLARAYSRSRESEQQAPTQEQPPQENPEVAAKWRKKSYGRPA